MIQEFINAWNKNKDELREYFENNDVLSLEYYDIVKAIIDYVINPAMDWDFDKFNSDSITVIDDGQYQGTYLYIIPQDVYQPQEDEYIVTCNSYGSCSGCDTLLALQYRYDENKDKLIDGLMTISLHLIERMKYLYSYK